MKKIVGWRSQHFTMYGGDIFLYYHSTSMYAAFLMCQVAGSKNQRSMHVHGHFEFHLQC